MTTQQAEELNFQTMPRDQGQIVEVSYACDAERGLLVRRSHDRSDRSTVYAAAEYDQDLPEHELRFEPWNGILPRTTSDWEAVR